MFPGHQRIGVVFVYSARQRRALDLSAYSVRCSPR